MMSYLRLAVPLATLMALLTLAAPASPHDNPSIKAQEERGFFLVSFDPGVVHACVVFRMTEATEADRNLWPDGHYAPRSCTFVNPQSTQFEIEFSPYIYNPKTGKDYDVDWDVYAELWTAASDSPVETNRVRFHR